MKKLLLFSTSFVLALALSSQTVIFEDNFDSYTAGMGVVAQSSDWSNWASGSDTDGMVDDAFAFSGSNSALIDGTGTDLVLPIGPYNGSGKYDMKWKMMVEEGAGGYFNVMHQWTATTTNYQWAVDVFFSATGMVTWTVGGSPGGSAQVSTGTWFDIQVTADLDNDEGKIYLDGVELVTWQWSLDNANGNAGLNQLAAIDFYGTNDSTNGNGTYWIDDVQVINSTGVGVARIADTTTPSFYPNPAQNQVTLQHMESWNGGKVEVMDLTGKIVIVSNITGNSASKTLDTSSLLDGIYMIKFTSNNREYTRKLVVRN